MVVWGTLGREGAVPPARVTRQFVQPREPATGSFHGDAFVISPAEIFAADHPLVREFPHLFRAVSETRDRPAVEQMTAAPGELRGLA
jgi:hypothetical protein